MKELKQPLFFVCYRKTRFGSVALVWSEHGEQPKIHRIALSSPCAPAEQTIQLKFSGPAHRSCREIEKTASEIRAFLDGADLRFSLNLIRLDLCPEFQKKVLRAEHKIPRGSVSTYLRIARHLGTPSGARAVGGALANNPFPVIIPCHRAVRSDRGLGGYQGGIAMKRQLLEAEGIDFDDAGKVTAENRFYYDRV